MFYALCPYNKVFPCFLSSFLQKCNLTYDEFICYHSTVSNCFIKCGIPIHPQVCIFNQWIQPVSLFLNGSWFYAAIVTLYFFLLSSFPEANAAWKCSKSSSSQLVDAGSLILYSFVVLDLKVMNILICIFAPCFSSHSSFLNLRSNST